MAATLTAPEADLVHFSFPIEKSEDKGTINPVDGTPDIEIWGKATDGTLDSDLAGDVTGTQAATTVGKIQGVAVTVADANLVSGLNNATARTATATLLAGEETIFSGPRPRRPSRCPRRRPHPRSTRSPTPPRSA